MQINNHDDLVRNQNVVVSIVISGGVMLLQLHDESSHILWKFDQ